MAPLVAASGAVAVSWMRMHPGERAALTPELLRWPGLGHHQTVAHSEALRNGSGFPSATWRNSRLEARATPLWRRAENGVESG